MNELLWIYVGMTIFMFLFVFMLPGVILHESRLDKPNNAVGFRTRLSSRSQETWEYANYTSGKLVIFYGFMFLIINIVFVIILALGFSKTFPSILVIIPEVLPIFIYAFIIYKVQINLRNEFDSSGSRNKTKVAIK